MSLSTEAYCAAREAELERAINLLKQARDMLDDVHCYDTPLFDEIGEFLEGAE